VREGISIADVVSDRAIETSEAATEVMKLISSAAADLRMPGIVSELGQVQALGVDPLEGVPEVMPVQKQVATADASEEPQFEVPFNIEVLRRHLGQASLARNALSDDIAARQKLLEQSVYDVAKERLARDKDQMAALDMGPRLQHADLQKWMWDWHQSLRDKLKMDIAAIIEEENSWAGTLTN
jgi:DNA-directed RNA polymerase, mitochondrial